MTRRMGIIAVCSALLLGLPVIALSYAVAIPHAFDELVLRAAAGNGDVKIVTQLLQKKDVEIHADHDQALGLAAAGGHADVVRLLLLNGADIHANNDQALSVAVGKGYTSTVEVLLDFGANVCGCHGRALIMMARTDGNYGLADLINKKALLEGPSCSRSTCRAPM